MAVATISRVKENSSEDISTLPERTRGTGKDFSVMIGSATTTTLTEGEYE
jgi:hypothetical protein